ncbi:hypothetical protein PAMP_010661 [Pampus punctatissimus]
MDDAGTFTRGDSHDFDAQVNLFLLNAPRQELNKGKELRECKKKKPSLFLIHVLILLSFMLGAELVIRAMSRKKAVKGKGSSKSPKASPSSGRDGGRTGKGLAAAAAPSSGLVYPSRPSISNSGEFYDIAFKVNDCCCIIWAKLSSEVTQ